MNWLYLIVGLAVGFALTYLVMRYGTTTYKLGENLLARAKGDIEKAWQHVGKL